RTVVLSTLVVTDPGDSGPNTLRGQIAAANPAGGDTITFAPGISQINLTTASLTIDRSLTITGPGSSALKVAPPSTAPTFGVFVVNAGVTATVTGLTVSGGSAANGGGFANNGGTLALTDVAVSGCTGTASGGGLYNTGSLALTGCTVSSNTTINQSFS